MAVETRIVVPRQFSRWRTGFETLPLTASEASEVMFNAALELFFDKTQQFVHVISGDLKRTGRIVPMAGSGMTREGAVVYGDEDVVYALIENDRGGEHAYLDRGWEEAAEVFEAVMPRTWSEVVSGWR